MGRVQDKCQKSQKGQGMLIAVMLTFVVGAVTAGLLYQSETTEHYLKGPRIRSAMMAAYNQMRLSSMNPDSFDCQPAPCKLRTGPHDAFNTSRLNQVIPYAACPYAGTCGVKVLNPTLTPVDPVTGTYHVTATIRYDGIDLKLPDFPVDFQVPKEVVQLAGKSCASINPSKPLFAGFDVDGLPNCKALPSACSGTGEYVKSFDNQSLKLNCGNLQNTYVGCAAGEYMTELKWSGGVFTKNCAPRKDPMTSLAGGPFPITVLGGAATTNSPGPSPQTTCTTTTTTTTTTSTTTTVPAGPTTTTVPSATTTTTSTTTTTVAAGAHCEEHDRADPGVIRGWGVTACTTDGAPFGNWAGNTCKMSATGRKCCNADFTVTDFHGGEQNAYPSGNDPSVNWIGIKCVSYSYCAGNTDRCVVRPSEQSTKPPDPVTYEYYDF